MLLLATHIWQLKIQNGGADYPIHLSSRVAIIWVTSCSCQATQFLTPYGFPLGAGVMSELAWTIVWDIIIINL